MRPGSRIELAAARSRLLLRRRCSAPSQICSLLLPPPVYLPSPCLLSCALARAQETFFLSANLLDRFLAERGLPLAAGDMNLLGITCLWVSSKHEETWKSELTVDQCVGVLDGSPPVNHELWRSKVQKAEEDVLARVRFQVKAPTAHTFLARFLAAARIEEATSVGFLAQLFCELCLASYKMLQYRPSQVAAAALFLSMRLYLGAGAWAALMQLEMPGGEPAVREVARAAMALAVGPA